LPLAVLGKDIGGTVEETLFPLRLGKRRGGREGGTGCEWREEGREGGREEHTWKTYHDRPPFLPQDLVVFIDDVDL